MNMKSSLLLKLLTAFKSHIVLSIVFLSFGTLLAMSSDTLMVCVVALGFFTLTTYIDYLNHIIKHHPDWFLDELLSLLETNRFISAHLSTIHRELVRAGVS